MKISRLFNSVRKRLIAGGIVAVAAALPIAVSAADMVQIEATTQVANASVANPTWGSSTSATYDQVVDIQVAYNNKEDAGSGKVASNLRVKINIPTTAGTTQTVTTKTSADNSNTVNGSATVNLNRSDAYLQYIPGSATWEHAVSANSNQVTTQKVSDDVVTNANGAVLENENPCQAGSIQVQARVIVPGVQVTKEVRVKGTTAWSTNLTAKPGDTLQYLIGYTNTGNSEQDDVIIADKLPTGVTYTSGSTVLIDSASPNGQNVVDGLTTTGINVGGFTSTANAYVEFYATLPTEDKLACGTNTFDNYATAQPKGMGAYGAHAIVTVNKTCEQTPVYSCDGLAYAIGEGRSITANVKYTAKDGATFKNGSIDWGDGSADAIDANGNASHTYSKDGTYSIAGAVSFDVNGVTKTVSGNNCAKTVTIKTETPVYSCDLLNLTKGDNRTVTAKVTYTAKNGATYKTASFDWGDNGSSTSGTNTTASHTYSKDGTYKIVATLTFDVSGTTKTVTSDNCGQSVTFTTQETPVYSCDLLTLSQSTDRKVTASVAYTAQNGAAFKTVTLDWGDNSTALTTTNTTASYQYAADGTYTVTAKVLFSVNGADVYGADTQNCVKQVSFKPNTPPTTPPELPNTGAGNVVGLFAGVTALGAVAYRFVLSRKLTR